ncbi:MAG: IPT/TIG domain-containing protein [Solirubrobacteraceae bacterium]
MARNFLRRSPIWVLICVACLAGPAVAAAAPAVTGISPNNGSEAGGAAVTITGTGFIAGSTVKFGSTAASGVVINNSTSIAATSPAGSGLVDIKVTNSNGTSSAVPNDQFAYDTPPSGSWLGLDGNNSTYLGPVDAFAEQGVVYDRSGPIDFEAGQLPKAGDTLEADMDDKPVPLIPVVAIEYKGYEGNFKPDLHFPTEAGGSKTLSEYVTGFVKTASAILEKYPGQQILFEPINEPWGYTTPQFSGAEYGNVIAKLLPAAAEAGIPLADIYVGATGKDCLKEGGECSTVKWVAAMYGADPKLETEIKGWYFHPYGPPEGVEEEDSQGIQSLPLVQAEMTSGQNNIIVSEVGYCALDVNEGIACGAPQVAHGSEAAEDLTTMLDNALPYRQAGWLKALLVFSRNDGGWAMQVGDGLLTTQGQALDEFAFALKPATYAAEFGSLGSGPGEVRRPLMDAVDPSGNIWVADSENNRVEEFSASGEYLRSVGSEGSGNGQFKYPTAVAINPSTGNLYVVDTLNQRVEQFTSTGSLFEPGDHTEAKQESSNTPTA